MQASQVELHSGGLDRPYRTIGRVEAKRSKGSVFSSDPTIEDVNAELKQKAAELSANAIINVDYSRGMSMLSYGVLKALGTAVYFESDEVDCLFCAEKIKRAAVKCRFCGSELPVA